MSILKKFIEINQQICNIIEKILPYTKPDITELYSKLVAEYANNKQGSVIVDIGGGRLTPFARYLHPTSKPQLIVIDSNKKELKENLTANKIIVANVNKELPLKPKTMDLIVSRYVFEHLEDLSDFVSNSYNILKGGGYFIHLFSCKFALFAILNQILPNKITKLLLNLLIPDSTYIQGFKTNYDHCYYDAIIDVFTKKGFTIEKVIISYYQSRYFRFFFPFYIISVIYEIILQNIGLKNLGSYILIIAKKDRD